MSEASEPKAIQKARGEKRRKGGDEAYFILTSPAIKTTRFIQHYEYEPIDIEGWDAHAAHLREKCK